MNRAVGPVSDTGDPLEVRIVCGGSATGMASALCLPPQRATARLKPAHNV
jgi:hypothetical protein